MPQPRVLGIVLAGGQGARLLPLTRSRSKAAVPFGPGHRIIDFVLSNLVNSAIYANYVLVQYMSQSLIEHVSATWRIGGRLPETFVTVVPPQMRRGKTWFRGTADAVYQNLNLVRDFAPDFVAVFGADHIYRMDVRQMIAHHQATGAAVTVAARPVPLAQAQDLGIMTTAGDGRVVAFAEKPARPEAMPGDPGAALASLGNYVFSTDVLVDVLNEDAANTSDHDFGKTIVPGVLERHRVVAYDLLENQVPGVRLSEEPGYWRDVGTIPAYFGAHMDLLGPSPRFDLHNPRWPIRTQPVDGAPVRILSGSIEDSLIGEGTTIEDARVVRSVLGRGVRVESGAHLEGAIVMDHAEVKGGARLVKTIVDRYNSIPAGAHLEPGADAAGMMAVHRDASGILVVPRRELPRPAARVG